MTRALYRFAGACLAVLVVVVTLAPHMRTYKRRATYRHDRRARAAALHAEGLSLRQIAARLRVSHETIRRDLTGLSHLPVTKTAPRGGECDSGCDSGAAVIPLRRTS